MDHRPRLGWPTPRTAPCAQARKNEFGTEGRDVPVAAIRAPVNASAVLRIRPHVIGPKDGRCTLETSRQPESRTSPDLVDGFNPMRYRPYNHRWPQSRSGDCQAKVTEPSRSWHRSTAAAPRPKLGRSSRGLFFQTSARVRGTSSAVSGNGSTFRTSLSNVTGPLTNP